MITLGVNIDHTATVRQARNTDEPDPVWAAVEAQIGGADTITFHLREDRRHIIDRDVPLICQTVNVKTNMEMAVTDEMLSIACDNKPDQCCLVPEKREELTTEGGLDVVKHHKRISDGVSKLSKSGIFTSAFIEPSDDQIKGAKDAGFHAIELWTGGYAHARNDEQIQTELTKLQSGIELGLSLGLEVHGGHGLTYRNVHRIAQLNGITELNIGHSIVARAVFVGMRQAVIDMKTLINQFSPT